MQSNLVISKPLKQHKKIDFSCAFIETQDLTNCTRPP